MARRKPREHVRGTCESGRTPRAQASGRESHCNFPKLKLADRVGLLKTCPRHVFSPRFARIARRPSAGGRPKSAVADLVEQWVLSSAISANKKAPQGGLFIGGQGGIR